MLGSEAEERRRAGAQLALGFVERQDGVGDAFVQVGGRDLGAAAEQLLLLADKVVDHRLGDACAQRELVHRSAVVSALGEQLACQRQKLAFAQRAGDTPVSVLCELCVQICHCFERNALLPVGYYQ